MCTWVHVCTRVCERMDVFCVRNIYVYILIHQCLVPFKTVHSVTQNKIGEGLLGVSLYTSNLFVTFQVFLVGTTMKDYFCYRYKTV